MTKLEKLFEIVPPHEPEIERSVLGCMLIEHLAYEVAVEMLTYEAFYIEQHQRLFSFFIAVYKRTHSLDELIVNAELKKSKREEMRDYIGKLIMTPTTAANVEGYCNELLRYARERKRLNFALRILSDFVRSEKPRQATQADVHAGKVDGTRPVVKESAGVRG